MVCKKIFGVSGMDNIETHAVMDDRYGDKNMELYYTLYNEAVVTEKITKLSILQFGVIVKRGIVGLMNGGIDGQSYKIGDKVSRLV